MPIAVNCTCGRWLAAEDGNEGGLVRCPGCDEVMDVPDPEVVPVHKRYRTDPVGMAGLFVLFSPLYVPAPPKTFITFLIAAGSTAAVIFVVHAWRVWRARKIAAWQAANAVPDATGRPILCELYHALPTHFPFLDFLYMPEAGLAMAAIAWILMILGTLFVFAVGLKLLLLLAPVDC